MISETTRDSWKSMIRRLQRKQLNTWESEFIESLSNRMTVHDRDLSWTQSKKLREIVARYVV